MTKYIYQNKKQLNNQLTGIVKTIRGAKPRIQKWLGDFLISYNDNKDSTPLSKLLTELDKEGYSDLKRRIIIWVKTVSNYKVHFNADKKNFTIGSEDKDNPQFIPNELFEVTNFYDKTDEEKAEDEKASQEYKSLDAGFKVLEKNLSKLFNTAKTDEEKAIIRAKVRELIA